MDIITNLMYNKKESDIKEEEEEENFEYDELYSSPSLSKAESDDSLIGLELRESNLNRMLKEIYDSTREIIEKEKEKLVQEVHLRDEDIEKINEKSNYKLKKIKYIIMGLNTLFILGGIGAAFMYSYRNTTQQTKDILNNLENYYFRTEKIGKSDTYIFKSQPRSSRINYSPHIIK